MKACFECCIHDADLARQARMADRIQRSGRNPKRLEKVLNDIVKVKADRERHRENCEIWQTRSVA